MTEIKEQYPKGVPVYTLNAAGTFGQVYTCKRSYYYPNDTASSEFFPVQSFSDYPDRASEFSTLVCKITKMGILADLMDHGAVDVETVGCEHLGETTLVTAPKRNKGTAPAQCMLSWMIPPPPELRATLHIQRWQDVHIHHAMQEISSTLHIDASAPSALAMQLKCKAEYILSSVNQHTLVMPSIVDAFYVIAPKLKVPEPKLEQEGQRMRKRTKHTEPTSEKNSTTRKAVVEATFTSTMKVARKQCDSPYENWTQHLEEEEELDMFTELLLVTVSERFGTDLFSLACSPVSGPSLNAMDIKLCLTWQLINAVAQLHETGWLHRDLKLMNVLVDINDDGFPLVRLCDMGSARRIVELTQHPRISYVCTRYTRAPELLCGATRYTIAVDTWSLGCLLAELWMLLAKANSRSEVTQLRLEGQRKGNLVTEKAIHQDMNSTEAEKNEQDSKCAGIDIKSSVYYSDCAMFPGHDSDEAQLAHIFNILGTPSDAEIASLRLDSQLELHLRENIAAIALSAGLLTAVESEQLMSRAMAAEDAACNDFNDGKMETHRGDLKLQQTQRSLLLAPLRAAIAVHKQAAVPRVPGLDIATLLTRRGVPADVSNLIASMLRWDPAARLTPQHALLHPALQPKSWLTFLNDSNKAQFTSPAQDFFLPGITLTKESLVALQKLGSK